jgi:hypothetical protein
MNRHAKPSAGRSNMYSSSKYTNWSRYDPQQAELNSLGQVRPTSIYSLPDGSKVPLLVLPLHSRFVRPFGCVDVKRILNIVPQEMLLGLRRIALLGGTTRQEKSAWNPDWCYGCYGYGSISLFAFPERRRIWASPDLHKPAEIHAYQRAGVEMTHEDGTWVYRFTDDSIRRFYLWDVLVHEIGHHVDRFHPDRSTKRSERFAEWFARTYGFEAEPKSSRAILREGRTR